jgi:hypothetical protein
MRGDIGLPAYFNLILIKSSFKKTLKPAEYIYSFHDDILSLGILGNPFFYPPSFWLSSFASVEMVHDENNMDRIEPKYWRQFKELPDGSTQIIHPEEYGEKLKRHAFFYMATLRYSAESYLRYVEASISDTIEALSPNQS